MSAYANVFPEPFRENVLTINCAQSRYLLSRRRELSQNRDLTGLLGHALTMYSALNKEKQVDRGRDATPAERFHKNRARTLVTFGHLIYLVTAKIIVSFLGFCWNVYRCYSNLKIAYTNQLNLYEYKYCSK